MALSDFTPEEIAEMQSKGIDPRTASLVETPKHEDEKQSIPRAILNRLKAGAGGIVGGGAGALGGAELGAIAGAPLAIPTAGISEIVGPLIGGIAGGMAGGAAGEAGQRALLNPELQASLEAQAQQAQEQHPYVSAATDITAGALASGGRFSPTTPLKALMGDKRALANVAMQAGVLPAINTGIDLAQGKDISGGDILKQAVGGALFAEPSALGRKFGGLREPAAEPNNKGEQDNYEGTTIPPDISPYTQKGEQGYAIDDAIVKKHFIAANPKPEPTGNYTDDAIAMTAWKRKVGIPIDEMRGALHEKFIASKAMGVEQSQEPLKMAKEGDEGVVTKNEADQVSTTGDSFQSFKTMAQEHQEAQEALAKKETEEAQPLKDGELPKPVSENTLRITKDSFLPNDVNRPEVRPEVNTVPLTPDQANEARKLMTQNRGQGDKRTEAERIQDEMEGNGARYSESRIDPKDLARYNELQQQQQAMEKAGTHINDTGLHPDFVKNWHEIEALKNKYGGTKVKSEGSGMNRAVPFNEHQEYWMTPEGTLMPIKAGMSGGHAEFAKEYLKNYKDVPERGRLEAPYSYMFAKKYARVARSGNDLLVENPRGLTNAQKRELKNVGIERNLNVTQYDNSVKDFKPRVIHDISSYSEGRVPTKLAYQTESTPVAVRDHINTGRATTGSVMKMLAESHGHPMQPLAKWLWQNMDSSSRKVKWNSSPLLDRSHYDPTGDEVNIHTLDVNHAPTLMEEAIHSMTSAKLPKEWNGLRGAELKSAMDKFSKENPNHPLRRLVDAYSATAEHLGMTNRLFGNEGTAGNPDEVKSSEHPGRSYAYAMGDLHEFIAHAFKNKEFQEMLNKIPANDGTPRTMWQRIVDAISHLLGMPVKATFMLDHVLRHSSELIYRERGGEGGNSISNASHYGLVPQEGKLGRQGWYTSKDPALSALSVHISDDAIHLVNVEAAEKGKGAGTALLEKLKAMSDQTGKPIKLTAESLDKSVNPRLEKFYEKNGFTRDVDGQNDFTYKPKESVKTEETPEERRLRELKEDREEAASLHNGGAAEEYRRVKDKTEKFDKMRQAVHGAEMTPEERMKQNRSRPVNQEVPSTTGNDFGKFKKMFGSVLDNLRAVPHEGAKVLADAYQRALDYRQHLTGKYTNPIVEAGKGLTHKDMQDLNRAIEQHMTKKIAMPEGLSPKAKEFFKLAISKYKEFGDEHIANNIPIKDSNGNMRLMVKKDFKLPTMANQNIENMFRKGEDVEGMQKAKKEYIDYNKNVLGKTQEEAESMFHDWKKSVTNSFGGSGISHQDFFNAIRKSMGDPLPPTWREQNPVRNMQRYFDRAGLAMAHYAKVESNHKAMAALGATKDAWGNAIPQYPEGAVASKYAQSAVGQFHSTPKDTTMQTEEGASGLATALFIASPGLEVHKVGSNFIKAALYAPNPYVAVRAIGNGIMHMREGWTHAKEGGLIKLTAASAADMFDNSLNTHQRMAGIARLVRNISTLGELTTKANAAYQQAYFEHLLPTLVNRANAGDANATRMMKHWDTDYTRGKQYSADAMKQLASTAASYVHGTGDIRQMPAWMMNEGEISGFMQLAHWSVAQTNNFMHDVWLPAKKGNLTPLVTGLFGSAVGGYIIKELREEIQGKKGQIPSLNEIASSEGGLKGNIPLLAYNAIAGMQYAGFGGLFSQVAKYPFDAAYKNSLQSATFPLDEVASDIAETAHQVATAMANDPNVNYVDLAAQVAQHVFGSNIKLASIALNQGINNGYVTGMPAEKKKLADKLGELRRFDMVTGLPYNEVDSGSNPFMNIEQRRFKMEQDPAKAVAMVVPMIHNIMLKYGNNPDVMMEKIKALKQNSYATMPSLENTPLSFFKYINYLNKEEGEGKAQEALRDYLHHKVINEAKASTIP